MLLICKTALQLLILFTLSSKVISFRSRVFPVSCFLPENGSLDGAWQDWILAAGVVLSQIAESRLSFRHSKNVKSELRPRSALWTVLLNVLPALYLLLTGCTNFSYAPFADSIKNITLEGSRKTLGFSA